MVALEYKTLSDRLAPSCFQKKTPNVALPRLFFYRKGQKSRFIQVRGLQKLTQQHETGYGQNCFAFQALPNIDPRDKTTCAIIIWSLCETLNFTILWESIFRGCSIDMYHQLVYIHSGQLGGFLLPSSIPGGYYFYVDTKFSDWLTITLQMVIHKLGKALAD